MSPARRRRLTALAATGASLPLLAMVAAAQPVVPPGWQCRFCPFPEGVYSNWSFATAYVSGASEKFGDFLGLDDKGYYPLLDAQLRSFGDGSYWSAGIEDLGLDSRSLAIDGGRPGLYRLRVRLDSLRKFDGEGALTPLRGTARLELPAGWVAAGSTANLSTLAQSLMPAGASRRRQSLAARFDWRPEGPLSYRFDYRRDERSGRQLLAGSFAAASVWLPAPISYVTDEVDLTVKRDWAHGGLEAGYLGTQFSNAWSSVEWQNPFTPFQPGTDVGRLALAPGNRSGQLRVSGRYWRGVTQFSAALADGRLEQDEAFIALSTNPTHANLALPRRSLDGDVRTRRMDVGLVTQPWSRLRLSARYERDERDNHTARATYDYVLTDLIAAGARVNNPYSFDRSDLTLRADIRLPQRMQLKLSVARDVHERTLQARSRSEEDTASAKLSVRSLSWLQATVGISERDRRGSDYRPVDLGSPLQNPLLRQYHLADRKQRIAELDLAATPTEAIGISLRAATTRDDYPGAMLGLTAGRSRSLSLDASAALPGGASAYASWGREDVDFSQAGSQLFAAPDWQAATRDESQARAVGLSKAWPDRRLQLSFDLTASESRGVTEMLVGVPRMPFPVLATDLDAVNVRLDYAYNAAIVVRAGYRAERYSSTDWQLDGVTPTTLGSVLGTGAVSPQYDLGMLTIGFSYTPQPR
jgi:MtrB/PioB family decaheme-associated outer membrane protein